MTDRYRMIVEPRLEGSCAVLAFEGWNDAGEASTSALRFVNETIKAIPLAEIDGEEFYDFTVCRPEMMIAAERVRRIRWPTNEFRFGPINGSRELVTFSGVEPHLRWRTYCDCMVDILRRIGVERVIMLGSYLADVVYSQPVQLTGFSSDPNDLDELGVTASTYQGPTGIVGVLADRFKDEGIDVLSLWSGLPHYINARPNPRGAVALVQKLVEALELEIDLEPMYQRAAEFEERISRLVAEDPELSDYVKQLKRREFAQ